MVCLFVVELSGVEEKVRSKEEKFLQREINIKTKVQQDNQTEKILSMGGTAGAGRSILNWKIGIQ